jgi:hypothetical protein
MTIQNPLWKMAFDHRITPHISMCGIHASTIFLTIFIILNYTIALKTTLIIIK